MKQITFEATDEAAVYIAEMIAYTKMDNINGLLMYLGGYAGALDPQFPLIKKSPELPEISVICPYCCRTVIIKEGQISTHCACSEYIFRPLQE